MLAEWAQTTPANWSSIYSSPRFCYQCSTATEDMCLQYPCGRNIELNLRLRSASAEGRLGVYIRSGLGNGANPGNILFFFTGGNFLIQVYDGGWQTLKSVAFAWTANQWYNFKARANGQNFQAKIWAVGAPEPAWMLESYMSRIEVRGQTVGQSTIRLRVDGAGGEARDFSEIRVTPISIYESPYWGL